MGKKLKLLSFLSAGVMLLSMQMTVFAETDVTAEDITQVTGSGEQQVDIVRTSMFTLPTNVISTVITPTVDFCVTEDYDEATVVAELDAIYSRMTEIGINTVYINSTAESVAFFNTEMNETGETDYLKLALDKAYEYNFAPYLVLDLKYLVSMAKNPESIVDTLVSQTHRIALKYLCEGMVIDNYYSEKSAASYDVYMRTGSGIGYDNWLYDTNELYFSTVSDIIHVTNNAVPVGIMINDMWANESSKEGGSPTQDPVQAYFDGFSDTKRYIEQGYADFTVVCAYGSVESTTLPFETVAKWWADLSVRCGSRMYLMLCNDKNGKKNDGDWWREDQLLRQLAIAKDISGFSGCAFRSYQKLVNDKATTDNLKKFFGDQINEETLFEDLVMQSPKKTSFTTYEPCVDFMGTFDANFDVYFNDEKIVLNDAGNFYFEEPLSVGQNKFTIKHKGQTYTYKIERSVIPIKSVDSSIEDGKILEVNGGTRLTISANAYKGANVVANINGKNIKLEQTGTTADDDVNSSYYVFTGTYQIPAGIIGEEQELGKITVSADYKGYQRSISGAEVIVLAEPEPIITDINSNLIDQASAGTGEVVGTMDPIYSADEYQRFVKVKNSYTIVYNGATTGDIATPDFAQLPAGTLDYYSATSGDYYITQSGKRIAQSDATIVEDYAIGSNKCLVTAVGTYGNSSFIRIALDERISYNIEMIGNTYHTSYDGNFAVNNFTASYVAITFDNLTEVTKLPDFDSNYVFSSGVWEVVTVDGIPKFRLMLKLRQSGVYGGCGASYNSNGELELKFPITFNSLSNLTVVIDPGHGYCKRVGVLDPGGVGHVTEFEANIGIAKELESQLKALGATVIRINSESEFSLTAQRPSYGRPYNANMFISIHANKVVGNDAVKGTEVYYFTSYSQPLASSISSSVSSYFANNVYSDGSNNDRGAKYSYYWVTLQQDFPSVLVETGFVSNLEDAMAIVNPTHQQGIATAIVNGIKAYLSRSSIS